MDKQGFELTTEQSFNIAAFKVAAKDLNLEQAREMLVDYHKLLFAQQNAAKSLFSNFVNPNRELGKYNPHLLQAFYEAAMRFLESFDSPSWLDEYTEVLCPSGGLTEDEMAEVKGLIYRTVFHALSGDAVERMRSLDKMISPEV